MRWSPAREHLGGRAPHRRARRESCSRPFTGHRDGLPELRLYPHLSVYDNIAFGLGVKEVPKDEIARSARKAPAFSSRSRGDGRPALSASTPVEVAARRLALGASRRRCGESKVDSRSRETTSGDVEAATRDAMPGDRPLRGGENLLRAAGRTLWRRGRKPQRLPSAGDAAVRRTRDERANGG